MASVKDLRSRISSVKNTQQITRAMKMVAAAKLRRTQNAIAGARSYSSGLEAMAAKLLKALAQQFGNSLLASSSGDSQGAALGAKNLHPYLTTHFNSIDENGFEKTKKLQLVVVSSDRGLCAAYNTNVCRVAYKRYQELLAEGFEVDVLFVGKKGRDYFKNRGVVGDYWSEFWVGRFDLSKADLLANKLSDRFVAGDYLRVEMCYTQFRSVLSQFPQTTTLLPAGLGSESSENFEAKLEALAQLSPEELKKELEILNEYAPKSSPDPKQLLLRILPELFRMKVYSLLTESLASELGSRMTAMDNATRNAGEVISRLTLQANRARQAAITTELMEIIGGAEALKG